MMKLAQKIEDLIGKAPLEPKVVNSDMEDLTSYLINLGEQESQTVFPIINSAITLGDRIEAFSRSNTGFETRDYRSCLIAVYANRSIAENAFVN